MPAEGQQHALDPRLMTLVRILPTSAMILQRTTPCPELALLFINEWQAILFFLLFAASTAPLDLRVPLPPLVTFAKFEKVVEARYAIQTTQRAHKNLV